MTMIKTLKVNMAFTSHFIFGMTFLRETEYLEVLSGILWIVKSKLSIPGMGSPPPALLKLSEVHPYQR